MSARGSELITTEPDLARLEPDWWALWHRGPDATPFTCPSWLLPWWRTFAPGELRCLAVRDQGRLVAFLPLWLEDGPLGRRLLPLGIGISDLFDALVDPGSPEAGVALMRALASLGQEWDRLELEELPDRAAALGLPVGQGRQDNVAAQNVRPVLALDETDPLASVPALQRRKLRMARNRVARRRGTIEEAGPDDAQDFLADLVRLHGLRWTARDEAGVLADERVRRFHSEALPALLAAGLARAVRLRIEGQAVGAYYGLRHSPVEYAYLGGFDPDFAFESPGTVLVGHAIEAAHRAGARRFDFLRGQEAYKYGWGAKDDTNRRRTILRHA